MLVYGVSAIVVVAVFLVVDFIIGSVISFLTVVVVFGVVKTFFGEVGMLGGG